MKIETGMYVRTTNGIDKIINIDGAKKIVWFNVNKALTKNSLISTSGEISKASYNIIDLIEEEDYVNGYLVNYVRVDNNNKKWVYLGNNHTYNLCNEEIKSVVTHEQFESMKYKIED